MEEGKMVVWGGFANSGKKKSENQEKKGTIQQTGGRVPEKSKARYEGPLKTTAQKERQTIEWKKTRDLFKTIGDIKWTFHAKIGTIKDRNEMDLTEAEEIKNRWQEHRSTI